MNFPSIETLADLIADSIKKGNVHFANLLGSLSLTNKTSISEAIKHCIDNEGYDFIDLIMLTTYEIGSLKMSSFEYALSKSKFKIAGEMLKRGFDINSVGTCVEATERQMPPIIFAIWHLDEDQPEALDFVLKHNPNLNIKYGFKEDTPLMFAMSNAEYVFAESLLNAGSDLMIKNKNGHDAFDKCGNPEFKKKLFSKLKMVNVGDLIFRETKKGNTDLVSMLTVPEDEKFTPLKNFITGIVKNNNLSVASQLTDDIKDNFKSADDQHSLIVKCKSPEMLDLLLKQGFDINCRDDSFYTPLLHSVDKRDTNLAKLLINGGANINSVSKFGNTSLNLSISSPAYDIANILLDAKADVTIKNGNGQDALGLCNVYKRTDNDMARWQIIKNRIEKLVSPQSVELKTEPKEIEVYVYENGANAIEIPKIEKIIIRPCWSKDFVRYVPVKFEDHHVEGKVMPARRLENGKWIDCDITFPKDHDYIIKVPQNSKPDFHIIKSASWLSSIQGDLIVRFDDFEYV
jgi:hypothetical protein